MFLDCKNCYLQAKIDNFEAKNRHFEIKICKLNYVFFEHKNGYLQAKIDHFEPKNGPFTS